MRYREASPWDTPWGEVRYNAGTTPTDYTYTGQYSNTADFGLMFYNARWYDPYLGRMAQADTIIPPGVQGLDRYAYVNNSPMNFVDPSGHINGRPCELRGKCEEIKYDDDSDRMPISRPPHKGKNRPKLPLSTTAGLPTNSCNPNSCSQPIVSSNTSNSNTSSQNFCPPNATCAYNYDITGYTLDYFFGYITVGVEGTSSVPGLNDSVITISNTGGSTEHIGFEFDNDSFEVQTTEIGIGLGDDISYHMTYGSGVSWEQMAINFTVSMEYYGPNVYGYDTAGAMNAEIGLRPFEMILVFVPIYGAQNVKFPTGDVIWSGR